MSFRPETLPIRDPIHGSIRVTSRELAIVESQVFQRLRGIKQLGFSDHAFPGATHTRFAHGLGAMEMATQMFDAIFPASRSPMGKAAHHRLRQTLRLAVLLHDVGHAPLSHATEACMPPLCDLGLLDSEAVDEQEEPRQATHEDFTIKLVLQSELTDSLRQTFTDDGIDPRDIARLISGRFADRASSFIVEGIDYGPLLGQLVSGELDADRMDYLQRDSYYAGVNYGKFDDAWLLENMGYHLVDDCAYQALAHRAIFAFEDFLLSRYHMFISVYYHHTAIGFDSMLARFIAEEPEAFRLSPDVEQYVALDDVAFWSTLRASQNRWASRIVQRRLYRRVVELNDDQGLLESPRLRKALDEAHVDYFICRDEGTISRYYGGAAGSQPIYVVNRTLSQAERIDAYSKLYQRYRQPVHLSRLYCRPDHLRRARACVEAHVPRQAELDV